MVLSLFNCFELQFECLFYKDHHSHIFLGKASVHMWTTSSLSDVASEVQYYYTHHLSSLAMDTEDYMKHLEAFRFPSLFYPEGTIKGEVEHQVFF